jgi:predicted DNA-binding transcriptional regulator
VAVKQYNRREEKVMLYPHLIWELAKAHRQMLLEEAERERLLAEYRRSEKTGSRGKLLETVTYMHTNISTYPLKQKDSKMNIQKPIDEQREMATGADTAFTEREKLAQCGFTAEEIVSVLWLRQWYQSGGSDRVAMVRHWEFLRLLVMHGKLEL